MNNMTKIIAMSVAVASGASVASAAVVSFTDLGVADALGALQADDNGGADLMVSRALSNGVYTYSVTYTGADFDGVGGNDTLTFDVVVKGYTGSTYSYSATPGASSMTSLGGASANGVNISRSVWHPNSDRFFAGETLEFTITGLEVTGTDSGYVATVDSFDGFSIFEQGSVGHKGVIGSGTGLNSYNTDGNADFNGLFSETSTLYVTSATSLTNFNHSKYGIENIDFNIEVVSAVPEPSSTALIGLGGLALILRRRK